MHTRSYAARVLWTLLLAGSLDIIGSQYAAASGPSPLQFVPVTPCTVVNTSGDNGPFGGPEMTGGETRTFDIPQGGVVFLQMPPPTCSTFPWHPED